MLYCHQPSFYGEHAMDQSNYMAMIDPKQKPGQVMRNQVKEQEVWVTIVMESGNKIMELLYKCLSHAVLPPTLFLW